MTKVRLFFQLSLPWKKYHRETNEI